MTGAGEPLFVDTNVLIFAALYQAPEHRLALTRLTELERAGYQLWISRQVLREFVAVLTRRNYYVKPLSRKAVLAAVHALAAGFNVADDTAVTTAQLMQLMTSEELHGRNVHDGNIVATMLQHGIGVLLTDNVRNFAQFAGSIRIMPLREKE